MLMSSLLVVLSVVCEAQTWTTGPLRTKLVDKSCWVSVAKKNNNTVHFVILSAISWTASCNVIVEGMSCARVVSAKGSWVGTADVCAQSYHVCRDFPAIFTAKQHSLLFFF